MPCDFEGVYVRGTQPARSSTSEITAYWHYAVQKKIVASLIESVCHIVFLILKFAMFCIFGIFTINFR